MSTSELSPLLNTNDTKQDSTSNLIDVESLGAPNHGNNNKDANGKINSTRISIYEAFSHEHYENLLKDGSSDDYGNISSRPFSLSRTFTTTVKSIPSALLITILSLMLAVPFGSTYFPSEIPLDEQDKCVMGTRLSLLALSIGQLVMGGGLPFSSGLIYISTWQLGELSPFYQKFASIAASIATDPSNILPTTLYLFSLSSMFVGLFFYLLGKFKLGSLTYFVPTHFILGLIGGIGVWFFVLSTKISISPSIAASAGTIFTPQLALNIPIMILLKILRKIFPREKFMFLDTTFFLSIPLVFYLGLYLFQIPVQEAIDQGYMFAEPATHLRVNQQSFSDAFFDTKKLWTDFSFRNVQFEAIFPAMSSLIAAGIIGVLVTAPFIPAIGTLQDHNIELNFDQMFISNGWSNILSAISVPGGLGVASAYCTTRLLKDAGGRGTIASTLTSVFLFVTMMYGPLFIGFAPRCMASAIILDLAIDLTMEGIIEPFEKFDKYEWSSVLIIVTMMNITSMTDGLFTGLLTALVTYALQSMAVSPIRSFFDAVSLPSTKSRTDQQKIVLEGTGGRRKIKILQLQGQIFFGNLSQISEKVMYILQHNEGSPIKFLILDFSHVLGIDSTSTKFIMEMNERVEKKYKVHVVMVSGKLEKLHNEFGVEIQGTTGKVISVPSPLERLSLTSRNISSRSVFSQTLTSRAFHSTPDEPRHDEARMPAVSMRGSYIACLMEEASFEGSFYETLDEALIRCEDGILFGPRRLAMRK